MKRKLFAGLLAVMLSAAAYGQGGTNSLYSQYGLGTLADQSQGFSRGMNGASLGLRQGNVVNVLNPASYSAIDSLTMIFDAAVSGQIANFKEGDTRINQNTASFEYLVGNFRLLPHVGMAFGVLPYTNVGYSYQLANNSGAIDTYEGSGGLHEVFLGAGWQLLPSLSIGANIGYLWGSIDRKVSMGSLANAYSLTRTYSNRVSNYKLDLGAQWQLALTRKDKLTLGATVGIGHNLNVDAVYSMENTSMGTANPDTIDNAYSLPMSYGVGLAWNHGEHLLVDVDVNLHKWGSLDYPAVNAAGQYVLQGGLLKDSYQARAGLDFVPNSMSRRYYNRVHYKLGAGYATPYYYINGKEGPKELSVSAGLGLPLQNGYNNRSVLSVSAQWVHTSAADMITENTFRLTLGLTFNERWFAKWKID